MPFRTTSRTLFWDGHWGVAFYDGVHADLRMPPRVDTLRIEQIDYAPNVGQRMVLEHLGGWRNLSPAEAGQIDAMLARMVNAVRATLC
jgi:hypothetical protein